MLRPTRNCCSRASEAPQNLLGSFSSGGTCLSDMVVSQPILHVGIYIYMICACQCMYVSVHEYVMISWWSTLVYLWDSGQQNIRNRSGTKSHGRRNTSQCLLQWSLRLDSGKCCWNCAPSTPGEKSQQLISSKLSLTRGNPSNIQEFWVDQLDKTNWNQMKNSEISRRPKNGIPLEFTGRTICCAIAMLGAASAAWAIAWLRGWLGVSSTQSGEF